MAAEQPKPKRSRARRGRGEGSIYFDEKKKLWVTQVSLGYDAEGKRIRPTVYGKTKREVQSKLDELRQDLRDGLPLKPSELTVKEHFIDWLGTKKPPKTRPSTYGTYEWHVQTHIIPKLGHLKLVDLDYRHINKFYQHLDQSGLGVRTVYDIASTLRAGLADATLKRIIPENPAKYAEKRPTGNQEARFLDPEEIQAFLYAARGSRLENAMIVGIETGLRVGELLGVPWDALDLDKRKLRVFQHLHEDTSGVYLGPPKSKAGFREITLTEEATKALRRQKVRVNTERLKAGTRWSIPEVEPPYSPNLVFPNTIGGFLLRTNIIKRDLRNMIRRTALVRLAWREGLDADEILRLHDDGKGGPVRQGDKIRTADGRVYTVERDDLLHGMRLNTLRHTHVAILFAMGLDLETIAERIGHEDGSITLRKYAHMMPGKDEEAASAVDEFMSKLRLAVHRQ